MTTNDELDDIREAALDRVDASRRWFLGMLVVAGLCEAAGLVTFVCLMDFADRTHVLILVAAALVYLTLAFWTWALAAFQNANAQRILKSIELLDRARDA